jgi:hypothetical protein
MNSKTIKNDLDYKKKALKYKLKYLELKNKLAQIKLKGGIPEWYNRFESNLLNIYELVKNSYTTDVQPILTGSGAIAYVLNYLGMDEDLDNLDIPDENDVKINPRDLDFLYLSRTGLPNPDSIGNFSINPAQKRETSVTFTLNSVSPSDYIKSFDVSKIDKVKYVEINSINIINLQSLLKFYTSDFLDDDEKIVKDKRKKDLIKKIIDNIIENNREEEFGLVLEEESKFKEERKKKSSGLFGDDSDDDLDNGHNHTPKYKRTSSLFGDDSDEDIENSPMVIRKKPSSLFGNDSDEDV